jgi:AsmA-like C-terminal region
LDLPVRAAARYFAWFAAAIVVLVAAAALVLPVFLDMPAVRAEIQRKLSETVQGEVSWEGLNVRILPRPLGVLRKARVEIPGRLEVSADELAVRLAFWPLLRGRAEIVSVTLSRPAINLDVPATQEAHETGKEKDDGPGLELARTYRSTARALADIVQRFAPETVLSIEDARLEFSAPGILPIALHDVSVRARTDHTGVDLGASLAGTYWSRAIIAARLQFADLSGDADIEVNGIKPQSWLDHYLEKSPVRIAIAAGDVRVRARTDGKTILESEFEARTGPVGIQRAAERVQIQEVTMQGKVTAGPQDIVVSLSDARLGPSRLTEGTLRYLLKDGSVAGDIGYDLDLAQGMDSTWRLVPAASAVLSWFRPVTGRAQGRVKLALGRPDWSVVVDIAKSDAAIQVRDLPGPVRLTRGMVDIDRHGVKVSRARASMPAGQVRLSTLRHLYRDGSTAASAEFDIDVAQGMELARRATGNELAVIQSAGGRARGSVKLAFGRKDWSIGADIQKADARVQVQGLPGATGVSSGSVRVTPGSVRVYRAVVTLLDTRATASTTIDFRDELRVQGSIAEGTVGGKFLEWVWQIAEAPPHMAPKTPINVTAPQFVWGPKGALDVQATARFPAGQSVAVDLSWSPAALHVRRATLKDQRSDAVIVARSAGSQVEGQFSGSLYGSSIAAVLRSVIPQEGGVSGKVRFAFDRDRPRDALAEGNLKGESLDISWLIAQPVKIERIDLAADGASVRIREATVNWAGQRATIRGDVKRGADGPIIDAQLDSSGIDLDALIPAGDPAKRPPAGKPEQSDLWPLPVTGQFVLRSSFVQRGRYRVAPFAATLSLQPERAHLKLQRAQLCGISLPLTIEATPRGLIAAAKITAQKQQLQQAAHCLTDQHMVITGEFDLSADLTSQGKAGELARNVRGSIAADMRDGSIMKFALLGNILSMQNISALMKEGGPKLEAKGFPYRDLKITGRFDKGRFVLEEGAFHSDAVGLAATGWVSLTEAESRLSVLVAPFSRVDELVRSIPLVGYIVGGTFTSVPVGVSGDIRDPRVIPLGPGAVTSELTGIFERALKLPVKLITPAEK